MKMYRGKSGFTLIELIMVIVILGILAVIAIPKFVDLSNEAKIGATKGGLGALRAALAIQYAKSATAGGSASYPTTVTTDMFADGQFPTNKLNNGTNVVTTDAVPGGTSTNAAGWWYIPTGASAGRAGAFSDGTNNTSGY